MLGLTPYERKTYDLFNAFNDFFGDYDMGKFPAVSDFKTDIKDNGDSYALEAELPGFDKNDIKIDVENDLLTISAEKQTSAFGFAKSCLNKSFILPVWKTIPFSSALKSKMSRT